MSFETIKAKDLIRAGETELRFETTMAYDDLPVKGPVNVKGHIRVNDTGLSLWGEFSTVIEEPCDRCLEVFERPVSERFDDRFVYANLAHTDSASERELHEEDFYDVLGPDGLLDVKDLVRQHIILAMSTDRVCNQPNCEVAYV